VVCMLHERLTRASRSWICGHDRDARTNEECFIINLTSLRDWEKYSYSNENQFCVRDRSNCLSSYLKFLKILSKASADSPTLVGTSIKKSDSSEVGFRILSKIILFQCTRANIGR
jgi:hypothetical protein